MKALYLGSKSYSRKKLLQEAQIPYVLVDQDADEHQCDWGMPLQQLVIAIAEHKMNHAVIPDSDEGDVRFSLTADTLTQDLRGNYHGKPGNHENAVKMIRAVRDGSLVATGFCIAKMKYAGGSWHELDRITGYAQAECIFDVPDNWIERYTEHAPHYLNASGGITIEGYGDQFVKRVYGPYSTIMGLPMYEVRKALESIGYF